MAQLLQSSNINVHLEIETLLNSNPFNDDEVHTIITSPSTYNTKCTVSSKNGLESPGVEKSFLWWLKSREETDVSFSDGPSEEYCQDALVNGANIGDLPIEYSVEGLKWNEYPVIGTYVDERIIPGFKYRVRVLGTNKYLFNGRALVLQSIGMGYGKRITMEGESHNHNNNYFYSDSHCKGFGFELVGIVPGEKFNIFDEEERPIGKATIDYIESHVEDETLSIGKKEGIEKQVTVSLICSVEYGSLQHGLMPLCSSHPIQVNSVLRLKKLKGSKCSVSATLCNVSLPHYGMCYFEKCQNM